MTDLLRLMLAFLASLFKSRAQLKAENLVLRQQVNVVLRRMPKRPALTNIDRLVHNAHRLTLKGDSMRKAAANRPA